MLTPNKVPASARSAPLPGSVTVRPTGIAPAPNNCNWTVAASVPALTLGIAVGIVRLLSDGERIDALVVATLVTWVVWAAYLVLRATGLGGRRSAYVALVGFAFVVVVRLALPAVHFS